MSGEIIGVSCSYCRYHPTITFAHSDCHPGSNDKIIRTAICQITGYAYIEPVPALFLPAVTVVSVSLDNPNTEMAKLTMNYFRVFHFIIK